MVEKLVDWMAVEKVELRVVGKAALTVEMKEATWVDRSVE